jgi:Tol biopolymer transport system component
MAAIIREDPVNLATLRADVPEALDRIVRHCLEKQPNQRFQSARDVAFALETLSGSGSHASGAVAAADRPASRPMVLEATFPTSLLIDPDEHIPPNVEVSPDGRYLVFVARPTGRANCLWLRPLDRTIAEPLEGTVGARFPFWSPDGRHVAFFAGQKLKRIAIPEGHIQSICDAESGRGGTWNRDGVIIFGNVFSPLYQVHAAGGVPVPLTTLDERAGELGHRWPSFLPDGRHFVYFVYLTPESADANGGTFLGALGSDARRKIVTQGSNCRIQQSGHLFFFRDGHVMAQPFDLTRHEPAGEAQIVAEHCAYDREKHFASFSTAESLIAWSPPVTSRLSQLRWVDRNGRPCGDVGEPGILRGFRLSHDGTQVAKSLMDVRTRAQCLWLHDVASNVQTRLTTDPLRQDDLPVWSPAGDMLAFSAISPRGSASLWRIRLDGSAPEQFHASKHGEYVSDWSPDGQWIAVSKYSPATDSIAAWLYPSGGQDEPSLLFQTAFQILSVQFSPDNRWIAYVSTESGAPEVYVTVFPGPGMKRRVSSRGGTRPRWRADGRELYFISAAGELMAVDVKLDGSLRTGAPQLLFAIDLETQYLEEHHNHYDVSADGQKFLVQSIIGDRRPTSFNIGLNWL